MIVTMRTPLDMLHHQRKVLFGEYDHITPEGSTVAAVLEAVLAAGRRPVVVDVGANCGAVAKWLAQFNVQGGVEVHHYEPQPTNHGALLANSVGNADNCHRAAVVVDDPFPAHYALQHNGGNEGCYETVRCTCDDHNHATTTVLATLLPECDILKIDCEAGEAGIVSQFIGARQKSADSRLPAYICIEAHSVAVVPEIIKSLWKESYALLSYAMTDGTGGKVGVLKFLRVANGA